jgi:hypothetical protein
LSKSPVLGVIQFPHPGGEHRIGPNDHTPWNAGDHRRKFIKADGQILDDRDGGIREGPLVCWAEWEAPSTLIKRFEQKIEHPGSVVEPVFSGTVPSEGKVQNTDPYIFGNQFLYTYCKQVQPARWNSTVLANLERGTLILFGSHLGGRFVLDTAFVVGDFITHSRENWQQKLGGEVSSVYRFVTLEPMYADPIPAGVMFRLYRGATLDRPTNGIFSFVPCLPVYDGAIPSFARPTIHLDGIITPRLSQQWKTTHLDHSEIAEVWTEVVRQVREQGLMLGVAIQEPTFAPGN